MSETTLRFRASSLYARMQYEAIHWASLNDGAIKRVKLKGKYFYVVYERQSEDIELRKIIYGIKHVLEEPNDYEKFYRECNKQEFEQVSKELRKERDNAINQLKVIEVMCNGKCKRWEMMNNESR